MYSLRFSYLYNYVNDFEKEFISANCLPYELGPFNISLLLYADDTILFSNSIDGLNREHNGLHECFKSLDLTVNIRKKQECHIYKRAMINKNERFANVI